MRTPSVPLLMITGLLGCTVDLPESVTSALSTKGATPLTSPNPQPIVTPSPTPAPPSESLTPTVDDLSGVFDSARSGTELPALAGAVWRGEQLIAIGATGTRRWGQNDPVTIDDRWHLGSDTKAMTATLAGILIDRGLLHFEDTIGQIFAGEGIDPGYRDVTLLQLLQHRSGAPANMPPDIWQAMRATTDPAERRSAVLGLLSRAPGGTAGSYVYSNAGYIVVGAAFERLTGKTWETLIREELFVPLGMTSAGFGAPGAADQIPSPWGHRLDQDNTTLIPMQPGPQADNPPSLGPAGTVHASLKDWGKFLTLTLRAARNEATPLVSAATWQRLLTPPQGGDYACGWGTTNRTWAGGHGTAFTHTGSNTMWTATVWLAPGKNLAFAVVTNRGDDSAFKLVDSAFWPLIQRYASS